MQARIFVFTLPTALAAALLAMGCGGGTSAPNDGLPTGTGQDAGTHEAGTVQRPTDDLPEAGVVGPGPRVDVGTPSDVYPAPHPAPPTVISLGGDVLKAPSIVTVTFDGDPERQSLEDFGATFGTTDFWAANTAEYGVGAAKATTPVHVASTMPPALDDRDVQAWLLDKLDGTHPEFGTPTKNSVYVVYLPAGTTVTLHGDKSCMTFGGYHSAIDLPNGTPVSYAVVPRCSGFNDLVGLDVLTASASHELIEAATDAHPESEPAYGTVDDDHAAWPLVLGGGETADLCAQLPDVDVHPVDFSYVVQRAWSNKSALAGHDPCVPVPIDEVYFNAAPVLPDLVTFSAQGDRVTTRGVHIPVGSSKTIEVDLFSDGPMDPWFVGAKDNATLEHRPRELDFKWDAEQGQNGQKLHLTITVLHEGEGGAEGFVLVSQAGASANSKLHVWVGIVGN
jgi:hypothetical protein